VSGQQAGVWRWGSDLLILIAGTAVLWLLWLYARVLPDAALVMVWLLLTLILTLALWWRRRLRRRLLARAYLIPGSGLMPWAQGGWFLLLRQFVLGGVLTLVLLQVLLRIGDARIWLLLFAQLPLLLLVLAGMRRMLAPHAQPAWQAELSWRLLTPLYGVLLLAGVTALALTQAWPDVSEVSLERAVWHLVDQEQARSGYLEAWLQIGAAVDGLRLWLGQQYLPGPGQPLLQLTGWILLLGHQALFVWSYLIFCLGMVLLGRRDELQLARHPGTDRQP
jgi:hypothetical protein